MIANYEIENFRIVSGKENLSDIFDIELNTFKSVSVAPNVTGCISLYDLLDKIRYNFLNDISIADFVMPKYIGRDENPPFKKILNPEFDAMKASKMTVCYNATFNGYMDSNNLIAPTNLMFLDIDGFESKEETLTYKEMIIKKYNWIVSCNLSLSRLGLHVIILVDKIIDNEDFNRKYDIISTIYFDDKLDSNAKRLVRHAIIPSDINIYVNDNPNTLNIDSIIKKLNIVGITKKDNTLGLILSNDNKEVIAINNDKEGTRSVHKKDRVICTPYTFSPTKDLKEITNNAARVDGLSFEEVIDECEFTDPNIPFYYPKGIDVIEINLHPFKNQKVGIGNRNNTIGGISMRLIYLNTNKLNDKPDGRIKTILLKYMLRLNKEICQPPLTDKEVINSVNSNWDSYVDGCLDVSRFFTKKYMFWSKRSTLKGNEKRSYSGKKKNEPVVLNTKNKIADAIEYLHGNGEKITQKKVASYSKLSLSAVKKYRSYYNSIVSDVQK